MMTIIEIIMIIIIEIIMMTIIGIIIMTIIEIIMMNLHEITTQTIMYLCVHFCIISMSSFTIKIVSLRFGKRIKKFLCTFEIDLLKASKMIKHSNEDPKL